MGDDDYADDFEDYEDEFEEDAADEEPRQALPAVSQRSKPKPEKKSYTENKGQTEHRPQLSPGFSGKFGKLGLIGPISSTPEQPEEKPEPRRENRKVVPAAELAVPRRHFIAPPSAETRQLRDLKAARLKALKPVLQLRDVDFTIYESPPLTGYELYVRHQSWNLRSKTVQTRDDDASVEVQTNEIEMGNILCQCPEDLGSGVVLDATEGAKTKPLLAANVGRLRRFIKSAEQARMFATCVSSSIRVVETLLSENSSGQSDSFISASSLDFSARYASMVLPSCFGEPQPTDLCFSADSTAVLVAYSALKCRIQANRERDTDTLKRLSESGVVCLWKLHQTSFPWAIFRCVGSPSRCLLSTAKPYLAFAGTLEGAVQLWDLREAASSHPIVDLEGKLVSIRAPSYISDGLGSGAHTTPIQDICAVPSMGDTDDLSIATLDMEGNVIVWLVLDSETAVLGAHGDYGQAIGTRVRLLKSNKVAPPAKNGKVQAIMSPSRGGDARSILPTRYMCMNFLLNDPSRFVIGNDEGQALHCSRYSDVALSPRHFEHHFPESSSPVQSLSFCPTHPSYLLIGRADGSISLHHVDDGQPLLTWQGFTSSGISQLGWATTRPALFWVLDSNNVMHIFEPLEVVGRPSMSIPLTPSSASYPVRFCLDNTQEVNYGQVQRMMAMNFTKDGKPVGIEVHVINEKLSAPKKGERDELLAWLDSL